MNRQTVTGRLFVGALAALLMVLFSAPGALATEPWWHLHEQAVPGVLHAGAAADEVQQITVAATAGQVTVIEPVSYEAALAGGGFAALKYTMFPYDATAAQAQSALESIYGAGNVEVAGGPGDVSGSKPYVVTFIGSLADRPLAEMITYFNLGGLNGSATVSERTQGHADGDIVLTAANLGDAAAEGAGNPIALTDTLPAGLTAVSISGRQENRYQAGTAPTCALKTLTCTFTRKLPPYVGVEVVIGVVVQAGARSSETNVATVAGGGARTVAVSTPVAIGGAPAGFGVSDYELSPEEEGGAVDTQAGSHPYQLTTTITVNQTLERKPVALPKDLRFKLPPGLIGNPHPFPQCTLAQFNGTTEFGNLCAANTVVGIARTAINLKGGLDTFSTPLFNLEPAVGEPARFGFLLPGTPVMLDTSVRTGGDYGVTVSVSNISQTAALLGSEVTFWGVPGDTRHDAQRSGGCLIRAENEEQYVEEGRAAELPACDGSLGEHTPPPLLALPTSCTGPLTSVVEADPWNKEGSFAPYPLSTPLPGLDGCNRLPFASSISVAPDGEDGSSPSGLTVGVHVSQEEALNSEGLAPSDVRNTTVTLPAGMTLNPAAADGLQACSLGQISLETDAASACPDASKVGTVVLKSPLLPNALNGAVYLGEQNQNPFGSLLALYLVVEDPVSGTLIKVAGEVKPDPVTGQLVSTFKDTPQLPFEDLKLHFFGGARAPLSTPAYCGTYTTRAVITPWSGSPPSEPSSSFQITSGPNGSACADPLPFAPELTAGSTNIQAGAFSAFTMTMSRQDGNQNLDAIQLHMPPGLLGTLSNVRLCGETQANAGTCGPESLIGHTIVSVGLGGDPYTVTGGRVYITEGYEGAPYGLSIVNPAKAGPFDLGQVVVRAKLEVDPLTAAITVTTDKSGPYAIPQMLDGIPLQIKHVNVTIDRERFTFNPTDCAPMQITGSLTSSNGSKSALAVPFQVTNCATLKFKPLFRVYTNGKTSRKKGASLDVRLSYPKAPWDTFANIRSVKVDLPRQLPSFLETLQHACPGETFAANPAGCPSGSIVGTATATTPILPVSLSGPAYFVSHGGAKWPELVIVLSGYGTTVYLHGETFINKGVTSSTFRTIPDVPVQSFELKLPQGANHALAANGNLCTAKLLMPTAFTGQNGLQIHQTTKITTTGCPKHKKHKKHKHKHKHHNNKHHKHNKK